MVKSTPPTLLSLGLLALTGCAATPDTRPEPPTLASAKRACVDPDWIRSWDQTDTTTLAIDAGRRFYVMDVEVCPALDFNIALGFHSRAVNGEICGGLGDELLTRDGRCRVISVREIDRADYDLLTERNRPKGKVQLRKTIQGEPTSTSPSDNP